MIVDIHTHVFAPGYMPKKFFMPAAMRLAESEEGSSPEMILPHLVAGFDDPDGKEFMDNIKAAGIDVCFATMLDFGITCAEEPQVPIEKQLIENAELQKKFQNKLYWFAHIDPRRENAISLLNQAYKELGFLGYGEFDLLDLCLEDDVFQPIFKMCSDIDVPVFIHTRCGAGIGGILGENDFTTDNPRHPERVSWLLKTYPELKVIMGHAGYPIWWENVAQVVSQSDRGYLEISNWDLELHSQGEAALISKLAYWRDTVGTERIFFGSDYVSGSLGQGRVIPLSDWVNFFKHLPAKAAEYGYKFTNEEVDLILGDNASRLFRL